MQKSAKKRGKQLDLSVRNGSGFTIVQFLDAERPNDFSAV
jgi:hypothetical protein